MSDWASLNGQRIVSASVVIPYYGAWTADVTIASSSAIAPESTIVLGDLTLTGFVFRTYAFSGARSARIVGGFGGWMKTIPAKAYQNPGGVPLTMILGDAAAECGETFTLTGTDWRAQFAGQNAGQAFTRDKGPAQRTLRRFAGALWWIDANGVTRLDARSGGAIASSFQVIGFSGARGHFTVATETLSDWMPGRSFSSPTVTTPQTISTVMHSTDGGAMRTEVLAT